MTIRLFGTPVLCLKPVVGLCWWTRLLLLSVIRVERDQGSENTVTSFGKTKSCYAGVEVKSKQVSLKSFAEDGE